MPVRKTLYSLFALGGLGITAMTASGYLPAGHASNAGVAELLNTSLGPVPHQPGLRLRASLLQDLECRPEGGPMEELRQAARARLVQINSLPWAEFEGSGASERISRGEASDPLDDFVVATAENNLNLEVPPTLPDLDQALWSRHTLNEGEHLGALWNNAWGLQMRTLYRLLEDSESASILNRVFPGQKVEWLVDSDGILKRLRLWSDRAEGNEWARLDGTDAYSRRQIESAREVTHQVVAGQIRSDVPASAAVNDALSPPAVAALPAILDGYLPEPEAVRDGDQYTVLVEQETLVGDDTPYDVRLLAFSYSGQQFSVSAVRHIDGLFYTPDGQGLLPPFDRKPFSGSYRITSGYHSGRRHPVTGRVAPHLGTDFATPVGTPIIAPADGKVTQVDSHPHAGHYLVIEHGQGYTTRYLHLQKALVRPGQSVERGQRIALSGNSGRTTSAHLHYELHVDGRAVDAMRVQLPQNETLTGAELERFQRIAQPLIAALQDATPAREIAMHPFPGQDF
ncbi:peptidoglycan DD-metalloendopeptidase family protein [Thioalkalivibrio sp.]|uniref:peptidoglycan DD-metalloendopeptidase family protein n=1 Tax=Thioalkalivibrio sp. TaxID=2093813 RepID=UPI0012D65F8B|nr:peptidoglycan DD-metalloendopeptidase family protein [Thioalkalivibrio sp.]TVP82366.1 MAG: peptidase M23 [Thioalkalivibrio sp.]